jgi:very-short-patch-repair endonuclease
MDESIHRARQLRRRMTDAERRLWCKLRGRRFAHFKFRRQVPLGPFIVDFICFARRLIVELDGGQHALRRGYDARRTHYLEAQGFRVVRIWNHELVESADEVDDMLWRELHRE